MKLATIGTSWITESFIDAAKKSGLYTLSAVYSRDLEKAKQFAEKNCAESYVSSLSEIAESGVKVVYIASPNSFHFEHTMFFLEKGINVICEKPLCTKKDQSRTLFETAEKNGVFLFQAFRHITLPTFDIIKNSLEKIAPVRNVFLSYNQYSSRYNDLKNGKLTNIFDPKFDGGAKFDLGVYPVAFAVAMFGKPLEVQYSAIPLSSGVDGAGAYILKFDGFLVNISFSKTSEDIIENQIIGENGGIKFKQLVAPEHISIMKKNQTEGFNVLLNENPMLYEAELFADAIENKRTDIYEYHKEISIIVSDIICI